MKPIERVEVLIVEDTRSDADLVMRALRSKHPAIKMLHLRDGQEALDYVLAKGAYTGRDQSSMPRVIFLDLKMPKFSGLEVLRELRHYEGSKQIPVVVLSSSQETPDIKMSYDMGANSYVVKPVLFQDFIETLKQVGDYWLSHNQYLS